MKRASRRNFLKTSAVAGVGFWAAGGVTPRESRSALETINFASVGVNGKGASDSRDAGSNGNMVAICDIDEQSLGKASTIWPKAEKFFDYRQMFDKLGKSIDAVTISTPDHCHAVVAAMALRAGKHCFVQKPLTHSLHEARVLGQLATEYKVATQMGNQGTANSSLREAAAILSSGTLGAVTEVHVWTNRPVWPQGLDRPGEKPEVPSHIHWPEFIGPAAMRDYHPTYHPFKWRGWWAFGTGALGDMACHTLNMPFMGLNLRDPVSVQAQTSGHNKETYPKWSIIDFAFPELNGRAAVKMRWYDGGKLPPAELVPGEAKLASSGVIAVGTKGTLYAPGDYCEREVKLVGVDKPTVDFKRSPGHFQEWVRAIKGGEPAMSNFPHYAGPLTETVLLGNLAVWADGKKVEWDAKNQVVTNDSTDELKLIVKHEYRQGYSL